MSNTLVGKKSSTTKEPCKNKVTFDLHNKTTNMKRPSAKGLPANAVVTIDGDSLPSKSSRSNDPHGGMQTSKNKSVRSILKPKDNNNKKAAEPSKAAKAVSNGSPKPLPDDVQQCLIKKENQMEPGKADTENVDYEQLSNAENESKPVLKSKPATSEKGSPTVESKRENSQFKGHNRLTLSVAEFPESILLCNKNFTRTVITHGKFKGYYDDRKLRCLYCRNGIYVENCSCRNFSIVPSPLGQEVHERNPRQPGEKGKRRERARRHGKKEAKGKQSQADEASKSILGTYVKSVKMLSNNKLLSSFTDRYNEMALDILLSYKDLNKRLRSKSKDEVNAEDARVFLGQHYTGYRVPGKKKAEEPEEKPVPAKSATAPVRRVVWQLGEDTRTAEQS